MRITVPAGFGCVASGELDAGFAATHARARIRRRRARSTCSRPRGRCATSPSSSAGSRARNDDGRVRRDAAPAGADRRRRHAVDGASTQLDLSSKPIRGRCTAAASSPSAPPTSSQFYESIVGDSPYPSFTLALVESDAAGRPQPRLLRRAQPAAAEHAAASGATIPAAFDRLSRVLPRPRARASVVGTGGRLAQLSRAVAERGLRAVLRRALRAASARRRGVRQRAAADAPVGRSTRSDQGPVYLGYRLGHIRSDGRVFRALVYNKGAAVLHMLRRLVGDEAFFRGLRRFYRESRFRKVGTDDFRAAMEAEAGRLARALLRALDLRLDAAAAEVQLPRRAGRPAAGRAARRAGRRDLRPAGHRDAPVRRPQDRSTSSSRSPSASVDMRVPLDGTLRGVDVSKDDGTLAEIVKNDGTCTARSQAPTPAEPASLRIAPSLI